MDLKEKIGESLNQLEKDLSDYCLEFQQIINEYSVKIKSENKVFLKILAIKVLCEKSLEKMKEEGVELSKLDNFIENLLRKNLKMESVIIKMDKK